MKTYMFGIVASMAVLAACSTFRKKDTSGQSPEELGQSQEELGQSQEELGQSQEELFLTLPSEALAKKSGWALKDLHIGFGVWVRECGNCHEHIFPDEITNEDWHVMTPRMAWNANISEAEQSALIKYILAAQSDSPEMVSQLEAMDKASH